MTITLELFPAIVFAIVMICWFAFAGIFIFRKTPPAAPDKKKDSGSIAGVVLQGLSFAIVWSIRRTAFSPIISGKPWIGIAAGVVAIVAAVGSVFLVMSAVKTLGKEWSIAARVIEHHKLATEGPYARVRHPIYTGMLGMFIATGLAISHWMALLAAIVVFAIGTLIRVRIEERLLRETFGPQFEEYARNVPAVIPGIF